MINAKYNLENLKKEVENARSKNYFGRIESFYKKLPKTECERCGKCCYDPPVCSFVEFMYAYELYDTFDKETKQNILIKALRYYFYSMVYKFPEPCGFLDDKNRCQIYQRSCLSCKRWGTYTQEQYEKNLEGDLEFNKKFQKFYKEEYNIEIPDDVVDRRLAFCDRVKIIKNPYNIQEIDCQKYLKDLQNVEVKCLCHIGMEPLSNLNINLWLIYFTFGIGMSETRIELIQQLQRGDLDVIEKFIKNLDYNTYL